MTLYEILDIAMRIICKVIELLMYKHKQEKN